MNNKNTSLVSILQKIGTKKCLEKAALLANQSTGINSLNLRSLDLEPPQVSSIAKWLKEEKKEHNITLKSISFSYNHLLGDEGVVVLMQQMPTSICEIGLVGCGIRDDGGLEILNWMKKASNLRMICMEQNNFSEKLKLAFNTFSKERPQVLVTF